MTEQIHKYPRTRHIDGSGLQADDDPVTAGWNELAGRYLVVEEKMDGANCGISFDSNRQLRLQSRGHYLTGGARERQFDLLKPWASRYVAELWELLEDHYVLYGEWCYGKHSIFYTDLPHYLLEFDILDTHTNTFLSTERRATMLENAPFIASVKVLHNGPVSSLETLTALVGPSHFIAPDHQAQLRESALEAGLDPQQIQRETDPSRLMEGLYIKVEEQGIVTGRYKYVRRSFLQTVFDSDSHWMDRPLLPNRLRTGTSLW